MINIALWCPKADFNNLSLDEKTKTLQSIFVDSYLKMKEKNSSQSDEQLYIFLCPEWTFINPPAANENRNYRQKDLKQVVDAFLKFSQSYPDALIVIGSMKVTKEFNPKKTDKYQVHFADQLKRKSVTEFINKSHFTKNVALIFFNGKRIRYNKKIDALDIDIGFKGKFYPGHYSNILKCGNYRIGFEICADHAEALVRKEVKNNKENVDLHLVISDTVGNKFAHITSFNPDSFILFAHTPAGFYDTTNPASKNVGVWLGNENLGFNQIKQTESNQSDNLQIYTNISIKNLSANQFVDPHLDDSDLELPDLEIDNESIPKLDKPKK